MPPSLSLQCRLNTPFFRTPIEKILLIGFFLHLHCINASTLLLSLQSHKIYSIPKFQQIYKFSRKKQKTYKKHQCAIAFIGLRIPTNFLCSSQKPQIQYVSLL